MMNCPAFSIVDQQSEFIVVDKAADINFHDEDELGSGLFSQVKSHLNLSELYPVHRLDKMTSGLIIFAKSLVAAQSFQTQFEQHNIQKYYLAIAANKPTKKQGLIKGDMSKSRRGMWKLLRSQNNPAITQFFSYSIGAGRRLYLLKPHSGKTHQIRVALNSIGVPILGDALYNSTAATKNTEATDRGYLHAYALSFNFAGEDYCYLLPPNSGSVFNETAVTEQLNELTQPWQLAWPKV